MQDGNPVLPTKEPKITHHDTVLHPKYLVGLQAKDPDVEFYRGDIYDKGKPSEVTIEAREWGKET